jgi:hypothetical protein
MIDVAFDPVEVPPVDVETVVVFVPVDGGVDVVVVPVDVSVLGGGVDVDGGGVEEDGGGVEDDGGGVEDGGGGIDATVVPDGVISASSGESSPWRQYT